MDANSIERALRAVGELLATDGERCAIVVTGGATMNLLGIVERATSDVDVIARAVPDAGDGIRLRRAEPFPPPLARAIRTVARDMGLDPDWMNAMAGKQWSQGMPPGIPEDLQWRTYGDGLDVALAGRRSLVALKLFAAVDQGMRSVHMQDLRALAPSEPEMVEARAWVLTQDAAEHWPGLVEQAIDHARRHR